MGARGGGGGEGEGPGGAHTPLNLTSAPCRWAGVTVPASSSGPAQQGRGPWPRSHSESRAAKAWGAVW